ncbi:MAG: DUF362 domain-containing protein [Candidatus Aminicenantaceae bacterium]
MKKRVITRRDFLRTAAVSTIAGAFSFPDGLGAMQGKLKKSKAVLIRDKDALDDTGHHNPEVIQRMLDEAVTVLLEKSDPVEAWKVLINPSDIVGIKSNVWGYLPTGGVVEQALKRSVMDAGVREENISIDDWGVLRDSVFKNATALINARPARTHHWSGMGGCIKNYIMFVPDPSKWHGDSCADLAKIWYLPHVKGRTKLNILLMLTPLFHGIGPHHFSKRYVWAYKGILVSRDPVAVDATGVRILQAKRREFFGEERPLQPPAKHIFLAETRHHLGVSNPERIELIKLGWKEDILI